MTHTETFLSETQQIAKLLDSAQIERLVSELKALRDRGGRLFLVGLGGSAANCSHAVNDFRKLCGIEAYTPVDNVSELTARVNDEGWYTWIRDWLSPYAKPQDALMVLSVGGGRLDVPVSAPITCAVAWAKEIAQMHIWGIVGKDGGVTKEWGNLSVVIPTVNEKHVTPHTEAFQMVVLHCIVSHPDLQIRPTKW